MKTNWLMERAKTTDCWVDISFMIWNRLIIQHVLFFIVNLFKEDKNTDSIFSIN
jgi:hypothetical protein